MDKGHLKKEEEKRRTCKLGVDPPSLFLFCFWWSFSGFDFKNMSVVVLSSSCRERAKNAIKQIEEKKMTEKMAEKNGDKTNRRKKMALNCFGNFFLTWTFLIARGTQKQN
jgi:hypothetical protein